MDAHSRRIARCASAWSRAVMRTVIRVTRIVGRVSMDILTVDLTPCPEAGIGAPVELWGEQVRVDEVAEPSGTTIGYELMCALARRVPVETTSARVDFGNDADRLTIT